MSKNGIYWLHRCTCSREKQVPTDHEFITPSEKTMSSSSHFFSHRRKSSQHTEKAFPQDLLAEAKSEILKQECNFDALNICSREFQIQTHSNLSEMDNVKYGYEESRREQARLHEELAQREKALRDTRLRNFHEVEELKRAQEMRIDEFSRNELRKRHATIQELTSQIQELHDRMHQLYE